jgi:hypothetical protein
MANRGEIPMSIEFMQALENDEQPMNYRAFALDPTAGVMPDDALDRHHHDGVTLTVLAAECGRSRSAMCGIVFRVKQETDAIDAAPFPPGEWPAFYPENCDGGMPRRWWVRT